MVEIYESEEDCKADTWKEKLLRKKPVFTKYLTGLSWLRGDRTPDGLIARVDLEKEGKDAWVDLSCDPSDPMVKDAAQRKYGGSAKKYYRAGKDITLHILRISTPLG